MVMAAYVATWNRYQASTIRRRHRSERKKITGDSSSAENSPHWAAWHLGVRLDAGRALPAPRRPVGAVLGRAAVAGDLLPLRTMATADGAGLVPVPRRDVRGHHHRVLPAPGDDAGLPPPRGVPRHRRLALAAMARGTGEPDDVTATAWRCRPPAPG